jgi:flagellar motor switch protein FliM
MGASDFLNQKAIDALFEARHQADTPDAGGPEIQAYDFMRPSRLAPRARLTLETTQGVFAQRLKKMLSFQLRTPVEAAVADMENVLFSELALSLGSPCAAFVFQAGRGPEGRGLLDWGLDGAMSFVDRLLGGTGGAGRPGRALTVIEQGLVRRITAQALPLLRDSWKDLLPLGGEILGFEPSPAHGKIAKGDDRYLTTFIRIRSESFESMATVGLPFAPLEAALEDAGTNRGAPGPRTMPVAAVGRALEETDLRNSRLVLTARLPQMKLTMGAVSRLEPGQVIDSGYPLDTPVDVHVNGRLLFRGALGQHRGQVGLRILDRSADGDGRAKPKQGRML